MAWWWPIPGRSCCFPLRLQSKRTPFFKHKSNQLEIKDLQSSRHNGVLPYLVGVCGLGLESRVGELGRADGTRRDQNTISVDVVVGGTGDSRPAESDAGGGCCPHSHITRGLHRRRVASCPILIITG